MASRHGSSTPSSWCCRRRFVSTVQRRERRRGVSPTPAAIVSRETRIATWGSASCAERPSARRLTKGLKPQAFCKRREFITSYARCSTRRRPRHCRGRRIVIGRLWPGPTRSRCEPIGLRRPDVRTPRPAGRGRSARPRPAVRPRACRVPGGCPTNRSCVFDIVPGGSGVQHSGSSWVGEAETGVSGCAFFQ